jgi:hypothetical protein
MERDMKIKKEIYLILFFLGWIIGCSNATVSTSGNNLQDADINLNALSLGNDFPPDIQIPDIPGMRSTAFVVSFSPAGVIPINLDTNPLSVSEQFDALDLSGVPGVGFPNNIVLFSPSAALLLGSDGLVYFNPTTGVVFQIVPLTDPIELNQELAYSRPGDCDFDTVEEDSVGPGKFTPSFPADVAVVNGRIFVTMSNACFDVDFSSFYIQGLVLVFDLNDSPPFITPASTPFIVLNGFNATGLTVVDNRIIATSTGDTALAGAVSTPETPSILNEMDTDSLEVTRSLNLGLVAANFTPLAVISDGSRGFIGSSSFSEVYEINLDNFSAVRSASDPIQIFDTEADFITDQKITEDGDILFVSSGDQMAVRAIDLTSPNREVLPEILDFSFPGNPSASGAGPMAIRPGVPGADYSGPDLFLLTGSPGTVSTAKTY